MKLPTKTVDPHPPNREPVGTLKCNHSSLPVLRPEVLHRILRAELPLKILTNFRPALQWPQTKILCKIVLQSSYYSLIHLVAGSFV